MKRFTGVLKVLSVFALLLVACQVSVPAEGAPRDTLRVALTSEPPSLTTLDHDSLISVGQNILTYNGLVRIDHATLEPVRHKLLQRFMGEKSGRDSIWEGRRACWLQLSHARAGRSAYRGGPDRKPVFDCVVVCAKRQGHRYRRPLGQIGCDAA